MSPNKKFVLLLTVMMFALFVQVWAGERGVFPTIGAGARSQGMGGAFVAIADDASAIYWNPAGLYQLEGRSITGTSLDIMQTGIFYNYASFAQPTRWGAVGLSWSSLDAGPAFGTFPYSEASYSMSFAGGIAPSIAWGLDLSWGVNLKYNKFAGGSQEVNSREQGFGVDTGLMLYKDQLKIGLAVRDLYTKLQGTLAVDGEELPATTKLIPDVAIGAAYTLNNVCWSLELGEAFTSPSMHLGVEYKVNNAIDLRAGIDKGGFSAGVGLATGFWVFDYAYSTHQVGDAQKFSVGLSF